MKSRLCSDLSAVQVAASDRFKGSEGPARRGVLGMLHGDLESSLVLLDCPLLVGCCIAPERSLSLHMNEHI